MSDCFTYATHYLSRYPKTVHDMHHQLKKKGFTDEDITTTIPLLEQNGYLNDLQYTTAYLHSEVTRKGKPLIVIKQKLLMKGIEKNLLEQCIEDMEEDIQAGQAKKIEKEIDRLRTKGKTDPEIIQTLVRRGFSYQTIKELIDA